MTDADGVRGSRTSPLWWLAAVLPLAILHFLPLGRTTTVELEWRNLGHVLLFGCLTVALLRIAPRGAGWRLPTAVGVALALAFASEAVQIPLERDADLLDVARDAVGIGLASLWTWLHERRPAAWRTIGAAVTIVALGVTALPLVRAYDATRAQRANFPVLFDFERPSQHLFLDPAGVGVVLREPPPGWAERRGSTVARVQFERRYFPRLTLDEVVPDWHAFETLAFEAFSEVEAPVPLRIRIDEIDPGDRPRRILVRTATVAPGHNSVRVPLRGEADPAEIDLRRVESLTLYFAHPDATRVVWLDDVRLLADGDALPQALDPTVP